MGCYVAKCKKCGEEIKNKSQLGLMFEEGEHEQNNHPKIYEKNRKAKEKHAKALKKINDELIYSEEVLFTQSKWDGENITNEEAREKGYID